MWVKDGAGVGHPSLSYLLPDRIFLLEPAVPWESSVHVSADQNDHITVLLDETKDGGEDGGSRLFLLPREGTGGVMGWMCPGLGGGGDGWKVCVDDEEGGERYGP